MRRLLAALTAVAALALLAWPLQITPAAAASLTLTPNQGQAQTWYTVAGSGLPPNQWVTVTWDGAAGQMAYVGSQGTFSQPRVVPSGAAFGPHTVAAAGRSAVYTVVGVTPTPTRTPTVTRTPAATGTPTVTKTPTVTRTPVPTTVPTLTAVPTGTPLPADTLRARLVTEVNRRRQQQYGTNVYALRHHWGLMNSAQAYSNAMSYHHCYQHHCPPHPDYVPEVQRPPDQPPYDLQYNVADRMLAGGYYVNWMWPLAELVWASGPQLMDNPEIAVEAFFSSQPHRDALLDTRYKDIGVGYAHYDPGREPQYGAAWAVHLGSGSTSGSLSPAAAGDAALPEVVLPEPLPPGRRGTRER